jgi:type II secretory pathway predicted ATPase ExeA
MYVRFYGLREEPFSASPDPRFLFPSAMHREAMASLQYCVETGRGFFGLISPPGMGKTTLLFQAMEKYRDTASVAFLFNTQCSPSEFIRFLLLDVGIEDETNDLVRLHRRFNEFLLANSRNGRPFILFVDEAQNLSDEVLETVRLLSNFETPRAKLIQIILAGQPELDAKLKNPSLSHLAQRFFMISRIEPLSVEETVGYIHHRLAFAGFRGEPIFSDEALKLIARYSHGIPRMINSICFHALSQGYAVERKRIDADLITEAIADLPFVHSAPLAVGRTAPVTKPVVKAWAVAGSGTRYAASVPVAAPKGAVPPATVIPQPPRANAPVLEKPVTSVPTSLTATAPVIEATPTAAPVFLTATAPSTYQPSPDVSKPASARVATWPAAQDPPRAAVTPSQPAISLERLKVSPVAPDVQFINVRARPKGCESSFGTNGIFALLVLICCVSGGAFVVSSRTAKRARGQVESVRTSSPLASTVTESFSPARVSVKPPGTNGGRLQPFSSVETSQPPRADGLRASSDSITRFVEGASGQPSTRPSTSKPAAAFAVIRPIGPTAGKNRTPPPIRPFREIPAAKGRTNGLTMSVKARAVALSSGEPSPPVNRDEVEMISVRPRPIHGIGPENPLAAGNPVTEGEVVLTGIVNQRGSPENLEFVKGDRTFKQAAIDAMRQWNHRSGSYGGMPAGMLVVIDIKFSHRDHESTDQREGEE